MQSLLITLFSPSSPFSVVVRAAIWFVVSIVIIANTDTPKEFNPKKMKKNLGVFLLFMVLSSGLMYLLFGFIPA